MIKRSVALAGGDIYFIVCETSRGKQVEMVEDGRILRTLSPAEAVALHDALGDVIQIAGLDNLAEPDGADELPDHA